MLLLLLALQHNTHKPADHQTTRQALLLTFPFFWKLPLTSFTFNLMFFIAMFSNNKITENDIIDLNINQVFQN